MSDTDKKLQALSDIITKQDFEIKALQAKLSRYENAVRVEGTLRFITPYGTIVDLGDTDSLDMMLTGQQVTVIVLPKEDV